MDLSKNKKRPAGDGGKPNSTHQSRRSSVAHTKMNFKNKNTDGTGNKRGIEDGSSGNNFDQQNMQQLK